jgi:hypothetical protein
MEFSFEVDPNLDLAIGTELSYEDEAPEYVDDVNLADVNPWTATGAKPGSEDKVRMLAARYAAGIPLWHNEDCYDHGPAQAAGLLDADGFAIEEEDDF